MTVPARAGRALGIDVGGTHVRAGAYGDGRAHLLETRATPLEYAAFVERVAALHAEAAAVVGGVDAVGIGLPGVTGERVVTWVPNLRFLDGRALGDDVRAATGARVVLANDAQMALAGECWAGAARGVRDAVLVSLGTGVGGAILAGGRVVRGATGSAGAFGWWTLDPDDAGDANHGALERAASGRALEGLGAKLDPPRGSYELVRAARAGDAACLAVLDAVAARLGAAVAGIVSALDPEVVLVSGGLSRDFDLLEPGVLAAVRRLASPSGRRVPVRLASLGDAAGVYGALHAALESASSSAFT